MSDATPAHFFWDNEVTPSAATGPDWVWHGLLARGATTLLAGHGKLTGKTTLLSILLSRRGAGGQLAGRAVTPGRTVYVSEEPRSLWDDRIRRRDFAGNVCLFPQPFLGIPTAAEWRGLIEQILTLHATHPFDLAIVDSLGPFLTNENNARSVYDALLPLRALTRAGMALALIHHFGKGPAQPGLAARGSSALLGHVDISIEMRHPGGDPLTRRRRFFALSRWAETPRQLLLELNADATDYVHIDEADDDFTAFVTAFQMVLQDAPQKLTRADILADWPADFDKPSPSTLRRWLARAVERGEVACEGTGRRNDPLRYWLPATLERWRATNPLYDLFAQQERDLKLPFESLTRKRRRDAAGGDGEME